MLGKIMVDVNLPRSPKLRKLAEMLRLEVAEALGHLIAIWSEALNQREDGVLRGWSKLDVEDAAGWNRRRGRGRLVRALIEQGWLDESKKGELSIHDWEEHQGNIIVERSAEAAKKRRQRAHAKGTHCEDCPVDCPGTQKGRPALPSLPLPSLPVPPLPGGEEESPSPDPPTFSASSETKESEATDDEIVKAVHRWDPSFPEHKIRSETTRAVRFGVSKSRLLKDIETMGERMKIWTIVDLYQYPKGKPTNGNGHARENATAYSKTDRHAVLEERREDVQKRQDEARAKCDALLHAMDPDQHDALTRAAEAAADMVGAKDGPQRVIFVKGFLRTKVAKQNGIEGL